MFGISPAKLKDTRMSEYIDRVVPKIRGWSKIQAKSYQEDALVTGQEINPDILARFIHYLLSEKTNHFYFSGCVIPYGA